ncbi:hypothetical protein ACFQI7_09810 [Paenibacillus allorhizosphaerae]|uniref:hypothetical protein n=1 Tax=Paenibacillus allorhizosphaerae TaxID=2849866 RepID=UPI001C4048A1|nr:hypothetical protein [Paenibacillus allorhizosphaerae]
MFPSFKMLQGDAGVRALLLSPAYKGVMADCEPLAFAVADAPEDVKDMIKMMKSII